MISKQDLLTKREVLLDNTLEPLHEDYSVEVTIGKITTIGGIKQDGYIKLTAYYKPGYPESSNNCLSDLINQAQEASQFEYSIKAIGVESKLGGIARIDFRRPNGTIIDTIEVKLEEFNQYCSKIRNIMNLI